MFFGDENQRALAGEVMKTAAVGLAGFGVEAGILRAARSLIRGDD
jgi:hypothetical protein